jgi:hypothetical protein
MPHKHFTHDNTDYQFTDDKIDKMNAELSTLLIDNNVDAEDDTLVKYYAGKVIEEQV